MDQEMQSPVHCNEEITRKKTSSPPQTDPSRIRRFRCTRCQKSFTSNFGLKRHLVFHLGKKLFLCNKCKLTFTDLTKFLHHQRSHRNETREDTLAAQTNNHEAVAVGETKNTGASPKRHPRQTVDSEGTQVASAMGSTKRLHEQHHPASMVAMMTHHNNGQQYRNGKSGMPSALHSISSDQISYHGNGPITPNNGTSTNFNSCNPERHAVSLDLPSGVTSICFNNNSDRLNSTFDYLQTVNGKLDAIIKHFNVPYTSTQASQVQQSDVIDTKNQTNHEYVCSTPSSGNISTELIESSQYNIASTNTSSHSISTPKTSNSIAIVPSSLPPLSPIAVSTTVLEDYVCTHEQPHIILTESMVAKIFERSLNRGNFSKNLVYSIFPADERIGRNCFGRRSSAKGTKKLPLDPCRLKTVKDITFVKYPCDPWEAEQIWRRECVVAIDTAMRGEARARIKLNADEISPNS